MAIRHYKKHVRIEHLGKAVYQNTNAQVQTLVRAAERTLNRIPGIAQDTLIATEKQVFKAPVPFTTGTQGYAQKLARAGDAEPKSTFIIKPKQSAYLEFPIEGGGRLPGDAGTSEHYVWKPTQHSRDTASGALQRFFTKQLVSESKKKRPVRGGGIYFGSVKGRHHSAFPRREPIRREPGADARRLSGLQGADRAQRSRGPRARNCAVGNAIVIKGVDGYHQKTGCKAASQGKSGL